MNRNLGRTTLIRPAVLLALVAGALAMAQEPTDPLAGRLDALEDQHSETKAGLLSLRRLKLSGYVQARYTHQQDSHSGVDIAGNPLVMDGFSVRRGRLKATYTAPYSLLVLQIDATPKEVSLRDAEVHFFEPWTGQKLELIVGQTKWPFGHELVQSSVNREFPERTRVVRAFGPGERDRGAKLAWRRGIWQATAGVFDGNGTANRGFIGIDNDTEKDLVGRLGVDLKWISGGVSGWAGKSYRPSDKHFARNRVGADAQLSLDLLPIGATALKGEFIAGTTYQSGGVEQFGQTGLGWYALLGQNLGVSNQVAVRYDYFDGYTGTPDGVSPADATKPLSSNAVGTIGLVAMHHFADALKASVSYEIPLVATGSGDAVAPAQNLLTVQFQAKY